MDILLGFHLQINVFLLYAFASSFAIIPNSVKTTIFDDHISGATVPVWITSVTYSDGLGKQLQSQVFLNGLEKSMVSSILYDEIGRLCTTVLPFTKPGYFDYVLGAQSLLDAKNYYNDNYPYSQIKYYPDPLERERLKPDHWKHSLYSGNHITKTWHFGINEPNFLAYSDLTDEHLDGYLIRKMQLLLNYNQISREYLLAGNYRHFW